MEDCIFCKIVAEEIPAYKVYEDDKVVAFLDISQATKGHTLVVPKDHSSNVLELNKTQSGYLFGVANKLGCRIKEKLNASGINILTNAGLSAGQTVFHTHIHIIPRYDDEDGFSTSFANNMSSLNPDEMRKLVELIK